MNRDDRRIAAELRARRVTVPRNVEFQWEGIGVFVGTVLAVVVGCLTVIAFTVGGAS
jgi:uncharacterized membrane protein